MADEVVKMFVEEYGPVAKQVSSQIGVAPSVLLSQWAMETNYGREIPGHFNLGNIKDFSGAGTEARDRQTKSVDKYLNFESPEAFGDYYAHMMKRLYPETLNTGSDIGKYSRGLSMGSKGSYYEVNPETYEGGLKSFHKGVSSFYKEPDEETTAGRIMREGKADEVMPKPSKRTEEAINPITGTAVGAATNLLGQVPFTPELPKEVDITGLQHKADLAEQKLIRAQDRLQERMTTTQGVPGGAGLDQLDQEFKAAQREYYEAQTAYNEAVAASKSKVAPTPAPAPQAPPEGALAGATPQVQTGEASLLPTEAQHERGIQGTTKETGITGRASQTTYQERTHDIAEQAARMQQVRENLAKQGVLAGGAEPQIPDFVGGKASTPAGVLAPTGAVESLANQQELQQRMEQERTEQERLAQQQEIERLKREQAFAKQSMGQAQSALTAGQRARQTRVNRAQTAVDTAQSRADEARLALAQGRENMPTAVERVLRPAEVTGVKAGQMHGALGGTGRLALGAGLGLYGTMSFNELVDRYNKGDRSPELMALLASSVGSAAALTPAMGPKTARIKGAGLMTAVPLAGYDLYKLFSDADKRVRMEEELKKRIPQSTP